MLLQEVGPTKSCFDLAREGTWSGAEGTLVRGQSRHSPEHLRRSESAQLPRLSIEPCLTSHYDRLVKSSWLVPSEQRTEKAIHFQLAKLITRKQTCRSVYFAKRVQRQDCNFDICVPQPRRRARIYENGKNAFIRLFLIGVVLRGRGKLQVGERVCGEVLEWYWWNNLALQECVREGQGRDRLHDWKGSWEVSHSWI